MNADLWASAAIVAVVVGIVGVVMARRMRRGHDTKVAHEKAVGHLDLRRRASRMVGRREFPPTMSRVEKAETMRGWVFVVVSKPRNYPVTEHVGWAFTKRGAERALASYLGKPLPTWWERRPRRHRGHRSERGGAMDWFTHRR